MSFQTVLARNYELKLQNDDYKTMDAAIARDDFMSRVSAYEKVYEYVDDMEDSNQISYIKLINVGQKVISRNCTGYLPSQVAFFLQNIHIHPRKIYLSLNAENFKVENVGNKNTKTRLEDDENGSFHLTDEGREYSLNLAKFIQMKLEGMKEGKDLLVLTGTAKIHAETVVHVRMSNLCYSTPLLNSMRTGDLHGCSSNEIFEKYPKEYERRENDKLRYRYPGVGGESYLDVIERVRPVIIELERQRLIYYNFPPHTYVYNTILF